MQNKLIYQVISKIYDLLDIVYFKNNNRNPRSKVLNYIDNNNAMILDVCTGTASNAITIAKSYKNANIIGIDQSKEMLHIANKKVMKLGLNNINLYQMNATETTFPDSTFDVILISLVLHEVPKDVAAKILKEAKRLLKPNGKLLIIEWEKQESFFKKLLFFPISILEPREFKLFLRIDMRLYFEQFGFTLSEIIHCDYTKVLSLKKII